MWFFASGGRRGIRDAPTTSTFAQRPTASARHRFDRFPGVATAAGLRQRDAVDGSVGGGRGASFAKLDAEYEPLDGGRVSEDDESHRGDVQRDGGQGGDRLGEAERRGDDLRSGDGGVVAGERREPGGIDAGNRPGAGAVLRQTERGADAQDCGRVVRRRERAERQRGAAGGYDDLDGGGRALPG